MVRVLFWYGCWVLMWNSWGFKWWWRHLKEEGEELLLLPGRLLLGLGLLLQVQHPLLLRHVSRGVLLPFLRHDASVSPHCYPSDWTWADIRSQLIHFRGQTQDSQRSQIQTPGHLTLLVNAAEITQELCWILMWWNMHNNYKHLFIPLSGDLFISYENRCSIRVGDKN